MADELPPTTPDDKGQTVRINIPADPSESFEKTARLDEQETPPPYAPTRKGQTVRINIPAAEASAKTPPPPSFPKKETTNIPTNLPVAGKPILPPPPISKPMAPGIPKPPVAGVKPAIPAPPAAAPVSPKKETARIQIPPQPKTPLHKATVKLEQPKPASVAPAASIAVAGGSAQVIAAKDGSLTLLTGILAAVSLIAAIISFAAFNSANL